MSDLFWESADFVKVWESPITSIHRLKYFSERPCTSGKEFYYGHAFFFYEQGYFELRLQNKSHLIDPSCLVFNNNGDEWVVSLPAKTKVLCTEIVVRQSILRELVSEMELKSPQNITNGQLSIGSRARTSAEINRLHKQLLTELHRREIGSGLLIDSIATTMCILALRQFTLCDDSCDDASKMNGDIELEKIERAKLYLSRKINEDVSLNEISREIDLSPYHFIRLFKKHTAQTPHQYRTNLKLNQAKTLLSESAAGVTEIAIQLGYSNPSHFSAIFKRNVGLSPNEFRRVIGR